MGLRLFRKKKKTEEAVKPPPPQVTLTTSDGNYQASYPQPTPPTPTKKSSSQDAAVSTSTDDKDMRKGLFCKTRFFHNMCQSAFEVVDADGSGEVDEKELYSGLLLIHLKLGTYAGPAACKPISRERCHDIFLKMDKDKSGALDKEEFEQVMMVLFGNVLLRVVFQYSCTLMIVPLVAQAILGFLARSCTATLRFLQNMDQHSQLADTFELLLERVWDVSTSFLGRVTPNMVQSMGSKIAGLVQSVPSKVWTALPLTLLSTVLGLMIVPWSLMKIDDWFQTLATKVQTSQKNKVQTSQKADTLKKE